MIPTLTLTRIRWLIRRLSRIYADEIPYRIVSILRSGAQSRGWFSASSIPSHIADARFGNPWVQIPMNDQTDIELIMQKADCLIFTGVGVFDSFVPFVNGVPDWNRDPKTGAEIPKTFGLHIDFRHIGGEIDIKYLWELNRHIWWVTLAQAYTVSGDLKYIKELARLIDSWVSECPYPLGSNWSSPVEHGIRLINWSIVWHLIGGAGAPIFTGAEGRELLDRWLASIYQHLCFISDNYSFYSSADNHLIGEAAGVFVAAHTWDLWQTGRALREQAKGILEEEILKQFSDDGVNLEQAICYHKFSLEFLLASLLCGMANDDDFSLAYKARMQSAAEFMASMMDCIGRVPAIGDSDDGRVFGFIGDGAGSPYESLLRVCSVLFDSYALAKKLEMLGILHFKAKLWLVAPERVSEPRCTRKKVPLLGECFEQGGYLVLGKALHTPAEFRIIMDVGPLGYNRIAGHGHADALSVLLAFKGDDFLIDPGTYCYNAAPELRHYFRGTAAHNTVMIDDADQSIYGGSFLWLSDVATVMHGFSDDGINVVVEASHDGYLRLDNPVRHFRKLTFNRQTLEVLVEDRFDCAKSHRCVLHWHFSPECEVREKDAKWLAVRESGMLGIQIEPSDFRVSIVSGKQMPPLGWVSRRFYERQPTQVLVAEGTINKSSLIRTRFSFSSSVSSWNGNVNECMAAI
jgi:hypothetical protein